MILVNREEFSRVVELLNKSKHLSVDTETTGLYPWKHDRLFSIQLSDATEDYYFNFHEYGVGEAVLPFDRIKELQPLFENKTQFIQNAKFDMAFLWKEGIRFDLCDVHDTEVVGRLIRNDFESYSLANQAERELGESKDDSVMEYLKKNKCFTPISVPGKDTIYKAFHFEQAPYEMITKYGCKDTRLTYDLGMKQLKFLKETRDAAQDVRVTIWPVYEMEKKLTHAIFEMERIGTKIDRSFCEEVIQFETERISKAEAAFTAHTKIELTDSGQCLGPIFQGLGFEPERTESGEFEITDSFLSDVSHPLAEIVQEYRDARKRANTYFKSYLHFTDDNDVIHANMKQSGTKTGRFSCMDPNLQNIPTRGEENSKYPVRRAFVPREGFFFFSVDYRQMEFRMMLDEAGQHDLIHKIHVEGHDPHDATAELTGLERGPAKNLNFGLLYGMGIVKLAFSIMKMAKDEKKLLKKYDKLPFEQRKMLQLYFSPEEIAVITSILDKMKSFKAKYFQALPMVENFILQCTGAVKQRSQMDPGNGWIKTWFGRRSYFNDSKWAYKAANAKIQGGCADVVKIAMINLHQFLEDKKSRMCAQIHDEILFELSLDELHLIDELLKIMSTAYPHRFIPLTCSMAYSLKSFHDLIEKDPREDLGQEAGNEVQGKDSTAAESVAKLVV